MKTDTGQQIGLRWAPNELQKIAVESYLAPMIGPRARSATVRALMRKPNE